MLELRTVHDRSSGSSDHDHYIFVKFTRQCGRLGMKMLVLVPNGTSFGFVVLSSRPAHREVVLLARMQSTKQLVIVLARTKPVPK